MTICKLENSVLSYTSEKCLPSSEIFHNLVLQKEVGFLFLLEVVYARINYKDGNFRNCKVQGKNFTAV